MTPPSRTAITRGDILTIAAGLTVLAAVMLLSPAAFDLAWILVYTVAAACALEMARNLRWFVRDDYPVFLALSVAVVAALQLLHVAAELGLVPLGSRSHEAAGQIALATGFVLAGSMLVAPFILGRRIRPALWVVAITLTAGLFVAAIVWWHVFPAVLEETGVSAFAQAGDLVIAGMLLAGGALTWRRRRLLQPEFHAAMQIALAGAALGWALHAFLRSDDITHLMSVLFIALICIAITRNGLARPTTLLFSQLREDKLQAARMRELTLEELRVSEQHYRTVFEQSPAALFLFDTSLRATGCNARLAKLLRSPEESIIGADLRDLAEPNLIAVSESALSGQLGVYEGEFRLGPGRDEQWVSVRAAPLFDAAERVGGGIGIIVDTTEGKRAEQLIERLAFHDALTGLANRTLLRDRLRQTLASSGRSGTGVALLYVDIDRFADLNHLLGRAGADHVLQAVAARLQPIVREADTIARWGADEFVVVLQDVQGSDGALRVATKVHAALADPWHWEGHSFDVTASVGIALFPSDGEDADALLEHVMIAAQEAKDRGGDTYQLYDHVMGSEVAQRIEIEHELRLAIEREELELFYQPQIDLATESMVGVEALVRWRHPARGLLPPAAFLPVAESTGLIEDLTAWVIGEACRQAAEWQAIGYRPLRVAVNLSARDFKSGGVAEMVDAALRESGLSAEWLEVELTETAVVADTDSTASQLQALRARGVAIALDDFGTGYSSITHLQTLPILRVKIDRSFVSGVCEDERAAAIVGALITLINSLGLEAVAEGVESADELAFLRANGCAIGQGYFFSRPLPAADLAALQATPASIMSHGAPAR
jgi:diguanylate cyclase (GGDEF)-like protein/PAS domain S-box-containing protein